MVDAQKWGNRQKKRQRRSSRNGGMRGNHTLRRPKKSIAKVRCYNCGKYGNFMRECKLPLRKVLSRNFGYQKYDSNDRFNVQNIPNRSNRIHSEQHNPSNEEQSLGRWNNFNNDLPRFNSHKPSSLFAFVPSPEVNGAPKAMMIRHSDPQEE